MATNEKEPLPTQIQYLINNMLDASVDIHRRRPFYDRLCDMLDALSDAKQKYQKDLLAKIEKRK